MRTNVVPTQHTRTVAAGMLYDAQQMSPADAVLRHLADLRQDQFAALLAVLVESAPPRSALGHPIIPTVLTAEERLRGRSQFVQGVRNDFTRLANREYQRLNKRLVRVRESRAMTERSA